MCWKYKNKHDMVFIYCDILNGKEHQSSYLRVFKDMTEGYYSNYNYCPYCGKKLDIRNKV